MESPKYTFPHMDATDNFWFSRQLEQIRVKTFEAQYPELIGRTIVPVNNQIDTGAEEYTTQLYDIQGDVEITSDYSKKAPEANVNGRESKAKLRGLLNSYSYSVQESRNARFAKRDLPAQKAIAARKLIERKIDELIFFGSKIAGFTGFCNNPEVPSLAVAGPWAAATELAMANDLQAQINRVTTQTNGVERANTIVMAQVLHSFLQGKIVPGTFGVSVLDWLSKNNPGLKIIPSWRLDTSGASGTPQIVTYDLNPEKLEALIPQEFEQFPPEMRGLVSTTICHARSGGTHFLFPKSAVYATGMGAV